MHYIIVFEKLRFHPPTRKQKAGVLKHLLAYFPAAPLRSLARSRETRFARPNRRACSQAKNLQSVIIGHVWKVGQTEVKQRRRVDAANECMMLPLEEFGHLPSQEVQEHCLQFQSLTDLLQ